MGSRRKCHMHQSTIPDRRERGKTTADAINPFAIKQNLTRPKGIIPKIISICANWLISKLANDFNVPMG